MEMHPLFRVSTVLYTLTSHPSSGLFIFRRRKHPQMLL